MISWAGCEHGQFIEGNGRLFCKSCGLKFFPPKPICKCYIDFDGNQWTCYKCGTIYDVEYLKSAGYAVRISGE